jgi:N6-L-threonylcarbamoyladenine synthase
MSLILGIESSCDETAAAVVLDGRNVRSNIVATQHDLHERFRGVVPELASRAHLEHILPVIMEALDTAGVKLDDLDAVAIGHEPGLIGSLLVGLGAAKALAFSRDIPLIGVNHIHAHLWSPSLGASPLAFPALGVVASGGHTSLAILRGANEVEFIGRTIDDALGEAFDKVAAILEAGYPGGPAIDRLARLGDDNALKFPMARLGDTFDVSYSGLKTAVLYAVRGRPEGRGRNVTYPRSAADLTQSHKADVAASFERAAIGALIRTIERALDAHEVVCVVAGGGVTANSRFRSDLQARCDRRGIPVRLARPDYCIDNAAMIAGLADALLAVGIRHGMDLSARPRCC